MPLYDFNRCTEFNPMRLACCVGRLSFSESQHQNSFPPNCNAASDRKEGQVSPDGPCL